MKTKTFSLIAAASLVLSGMAFGVQDYQVTGPVAEINDSMIVVEKGAKKERFELARDSSTKMSGDVKVGDKVTVHYYNDGKRCGSEGGQGREGNEEGKSEPGRFAEVVTFG